jgi:phosphatidylinositol glycan class V
VAVSHISHFGAVITLYTLTQRIIPSNQTAKQRIAFTAACLHILSPAGIFLSTPYGESTFAFTAFLGIYCYVRAQEHSYLPTQHSALPPATWTILAGLFFALSTLIRSNGLLHGMIFLIDALTTLRALLTARGKAAHLFSRLLSTIIAGSLIGLAFALPQAIAYTEFCSASNSRPWCSHTFPSIYSWVQKHYWNVGFLSYWTPGNIPLFFLAAPMLAVLAASALCILLEPRQVLASIAQLSAPLLRPPPTAVAGQDTDLFTHIASQLALPQLVLTVMALTSFHVQIINRIGSGCALWYVVLAVAVNDGHLGGGFKGRCWGAFGGGKRTQVIVRLMAAYAIVQGGLYASFLPPA